MQYHPEQPARIEACIKTIQEKISSQEQVQLINVANNDNDSEHSWKIIEKNNNGNTNTLSRLVTHEPFSSQELDHAMNILLQVHDPQLVTNLKEKCHNSRNCRLDEGKGPLGFVGYIDDDTYVTTESFDVCLRATAAWIRAVDHVLNIKNISRDNTGSVVAASMALTRPPGHHATYSISNGFCLFNFAGAAMIHALQVNSKIKNGIDDFKVSILDWDVHYGQGVADIVKRCDNVRYVSIHQTPAFPYQGTKNEILYDNQSVRTIPIPAEATWSCGYEAKFEQEALPFLKTIGEWEPNLVIVCAGYDALDSDELASVSLNAQNYGTMTRLLVNHVGPNVPIVFGLEGGYQLSKFAGGGNLPDAVVETILGLF